MKRHPRLPVLNLPPFDFRPGLLPSGAPAIYDPLRKKFVALTPEEWVRQHFVSFLINHRGYPASRLANEVAIDLNGVRRRCDTVFFDRNLNPAVIIEYKAPAVAITPETFRQIYSYNIIFRAPLLIVSNGLRHICCAIDLDNGSHRFLPDIPHHK